MKTIRERRRKRWRALMRRDLELAVVELIRREGVQDLTMARVAGEVGVAKGTVYLYFKNKDELMRAALAAALQPLVERVEELLDSDRPADEKLRSMARANLEYFDEHRALFQMFMHERHLVRSRAESTDDTVLRSIHARTTRVLEEGAHAGLFRPVDAPLGASIWIESLTAVVLHRLSVEAPAPREHDLEQLTTLFVEGLSAAR